MFQWCWTSWLYWSKIHCGNCSSLVTARLHPHKCYQLLIRLFLWTVWVCTDHTWLTSPWLSWIIFAAPVRMGQSMLIFRISASAELHLTSYLYYVPCYVQMCRRSWYFVCVINQKMQNGSYVSNHNEKLDIHALKALLVCTLESFLLKKRILLVPCKQTLVKV